MLSAHTCIQTLSDVIETFRQRKYGASFPNFKGICFVGIYIKAFDIENYKKKIHSYSPEENVL